MLDWELKSDDYEVMLALNSRQFDSVCVRVCVCAAILRPRQYRPATVQHEQPSQCNPVTSHASTELHKDKELAEELTCGKSRRHTQFLIVIAYCFLHHELSQGNVTVAVLCGWISKLCVQSKALLLCTLSNGLFRIKGKSYF